ncbi:MAG TPA: SDR family oxidoreductase [Candidatus Binatia bacterium]|nr:SDR family oxidoreductase [Candidatus Binatia bacterium]
MRRLENRIAIVTGAAAGIGRAGALAFAREGARVVVSDIDSAGGEETVGLVRAAGGEATFVHADAGVAADAAALVEAAVGRYGGVDVLWNNAGIAPLGRDNFTPFIEVEDWERVLRVNLTSVFLCSKYAIPVMAGRPGAAILNMASSMAVVPLGMTDAYAASKGGVATLTRSMAPGCALMGIRVNALAPGYVETAMTRVIFADEGMRQAFAKEHATGLQTPEEIAALAAFLVSDDARSLTGAVLTCDRGWSAFKRPAALAP